MPAETPGSHGAPGSDAILVVDGVRRSFGGLDAVNVDHIDVARGQITALIGPNGAGKTTLFNLLTGFDRPDDGRWVFDGVDVSSMRADQISRAGMVRTFQLTKALARMTVLENMLMAGADQRGERFFSALIRPRWKAQEAAVTERAYSLLERVKLTALADSFAGTLSGGQRKLLELARALMMEPKLVMLDEPMAGVNPALVESLLEHITALRDEGRTVVFVEHDMDVVQLISDRVVVMAEGSVLAEGTPSEIATNAAVIDAYLGAARDTTGDAS